MYSNLVRVFDGIATVVAGADNSVRKRWNRFRGGPLEDFLFYLILGLTGFSVLLRAALEEIDRLTARVEIGIITVAFIAMVALSFLDYLRREIPGFSLEIQKHN